MNKYKSSNPAVISKALVFYLVSYSERVFSTGKDLNTDIHNIHIIYSQFCLFSWNANLVTIWQFITTEM